MKRPTVFYGWYMVAAGALLIAFSSVISYGFTAFMNPIATTFGWSYAQISFAMSLRGLETGALNPLVGVAVDRWPARNLVLSGIVIFALGLFCLSQVVNLAMFYAGFLIMGLGVSLFAHMVPPTMVARWFRRDIGKASGILALGAGLGGLLIPLLVKVIDNSGWQNALLFLAVGSLVMGLPLAFVFRDRPEDFGLLPDGKPREDSDDANGWIDRDPDIGAGGALKMRAFWHIGLSMVLQTAAWAAVVTYMMPYLTSLGIERSTAGFITMIVPLASLVGRLSFGLAADKFVNKHLWVFSIFLMNVALVILWLTDGSSLAMLVAFSVFFGLGISGFLPIRTPLLQEYFGTRNFGTILGLSSIFLTIGMVASPPIVGWVYDRLGIYNPIWMVLIGTTAAAMIAMGTMPRARR
ncbi:MAG: MFS transporter [Proteobacteria bacterium]|nr:MFS transporter [Pseudomonadota bacterium]